MAECSGCGRFVSSDYVRVTGDNGGEINNCPSCHTRFSDKDRTRKVS